MSLSKITHQLWRDNPPSQKSKAVKRTAGRGGEEVESRGGGRTKFEKPSFRGVFIK